MSDLSNYRGITILNVMAKLFSAIRLIWCADANKVLNETQFGFRKNCKMSDPSSSLACMNAMHDPALQKERKHYSCFIDFLTVSHSLLWSKLANMGCSLTINMGWIGDLSEFPKRFLEEEECDSNITLILFCSACSFLKDRGMDGTTLIYS